MAIHKRLRKFIAVATGTVSGIVTLFLIETTGHLMSPPPADININDMEAIKAYTANAPVIVFVMLIIAYALGSLLGGYIAGLLSTDKKMDNALSVGGILLGLGTFNLFSLPHPTWVIVVALIVFIPFSWIGGRLSEKKEQKGERVG